MQPWLFSVYFPSGDLSAPYLKKLNWLKKIIYKANNLARFSRKL